MKKLISIVLSLVLVFTSTLEVSAGTNVFGSEYGVIKEFDRTSLSSTQIGDTGYYVSTNSSNYNNVVVRNKESENNGYFPFGTGLPDNGYYLFFGSGGNGNVSAELTLPETVEAGKYIKITYAKPYAVNSTTQTNARNSDNSATDTLTVGSSVIDLKANCEFDKWYTTIVKANVAVTKFDIMLGKWGAMAISDIEILDSADTLELTSEENQKYIIDENQTVQYNGLVYNSVTMLMGSNELI